MKTYLFSIETAFLSFPLIAFLLALPYMIYQYHKYGSIPWLRTLVIYSFYLYLLVIYYLAILPLPNIEEVRLLTTPYYQLQPFYFITDILKEMNPSLQGTAFLMDIIKNPEFYTTFFNILMFIPFGIYMRYYFKLSLKKTLLFSFLLSLFIEFTQLSGLYFLYPRPYRLFDVDDLIINTLGGIVGYTIAPIFIALLPKRESMDIISLKHASNVTIFRRISALFIDLAILQVFLFILQLISSISINDTYHIIYFLYFSLSTILTNGYTIGKWIVKIKVDSTKRWRYILRYALLYLFIFQVYSIGTQTLGHLIDKQQTIASNIGLYSIVILCFATDIIFFFEILISLFNKKYLFIYEKLSKTKNRSTFTNNSQSL